MFRLIGMAAIIIWVLILIGAIGAALQYLGVL